MKLGKHSKSELVGVNDDLVAIVEKAIEITEQDFTVHDGIRTLKEQTELVRLGASKTMNSRHLTGHAVDLVPYINGKLRWEWIPIYTIANAMRKAAQHYQIPIVWGGAWDVDFTNSKNSPEAIVSAYVARRKKQGKKAFIDGPHFELSRKIYH